MKKNVTIQFVRDKVEKDFPEVRMYRSNDGKKGKATYKFSNPTSITIENFKSIKSMYLIDEEGEISTSKVHLSISNNSIKEVESIYSWSSELEFKRYMRFAERYSRLYLDPKQNKS